MYRFLVVFLIGFTQLTFASTSIRVFHSERIHVHSMGYRLQNRIFQREYKHAVRDCGAISKELKLRSDAHLVEFNVELEDLGIRVGGGKKSTVEFACKLNIQATGNDHKLVVKFFDEIFTNVEDANIFCEKNFEDLRDDSFAIFFEVSKKNDQFRCSLNAVALE